MYERARKKIREPDDICLEIPIWISINSAYKIDARFGIEAETTLTTNNTKNPSEILPSISLDVQQNLDFSNGLGFTFRNFLGNKSKVFI